MNERPKILFFITEDWYFTSHRLPIAQACKALGWEVVVATSVGMHAERLEAEGFRLIPISMRREGRNPYTEFRSILEIAQILKKEKPTILHQVGMKPVVYGSLASMLFRPRSVVNALAGMGYIFTSSSFSVSIVRTALKWCLRLCINRKNSCLIVQNNDDIEVALHGRLVEPHNLFLIRGSGVDLDEYKSSAVPAASENSGSGKEVIIALVCRMLRDKGVYETVFAARMLKDAGIPVRVWLAGLPDPKNPSSLDEDTLACWTQEGCIEWLGEVNDIPALWSKADIAVLPSYREGMPRALLEAAACSKPIVTTDVPGCREVVEQGVNGLLVPRGDWVELARSLKTLAVDPVMCRKMGAASRSKAELEYSIVSVINKTLNIYHQTAGIKSESI